MKLTLNCMARNEERHVANSMAHFTALFDEINIIDHCSTDNTAQEIMRWENSGAQINLMSFENEGYYQSELMTFLARRDIANGSADWVFFLDFDEYLPFGSRAEFEQALVGHHNQAIIRMLWHNLVPVDYGTSAHLMRKYRVGPDASVYGKIAFQPKMFRNLPDVVIEQGNHAIVATQGSDHLYAETTFGLFHIPIDSSDQLRKKVKGGIESYRKHSSSGETDLGRHWMLMDDLLHQDGNESKLMNCLVAHYGENDYIQGINASRIEQTQKKIDSNAYREIVLDVAGHDVSVPKSNPSFTARKLELSEHGDVTATPAFEAPQSMESYKPTDGVRLPRLEGPNPLIDSADIPKTLDDFIAASYAEIETLTPTAWGGHIPFMFSLISTLRPRRYVELGTHCGASFFAACQTMARLDLPSLAVAIDLWEGDPQAGFYGEEVYNNFEYLRKNRYPKQSRSIRSYFTEAAAHFDEGSVDLIHIDGLHTFEAVAEDYETWRPKLTENGVIIFHDTNEYQSTFGVWDFFNKVRGEATASFEFKHTHGLGVMAFGDAAENPMIEILQQMNADAVKTEAHFSRHGELAVKEALLTLKSNEPPARHEPERPVTVVSDGTGITTKTLAKILMRRVKNKATLVVRDRAGRIARRS